MTITKTICRTIFYQFFLLFVGLSVGFLLNVEYIGWKAPIVGNSFYNTFFPIDFEDEGVLESLYKMGQFKIFSFLSQKGIFLSYFKILLFQACKKSLINIFIN